jgi:hypothetical protein
MSKEDIFLNIIYKMTSGLGVLFLLKDIEKH